MDIQIFKDYAEVKRQISALEEQAKLLQGAVMQELEKSGKTKEETEFGRFSIASRKNYKYSPKVEELEEKVELAKIKEREKGIAKVTETHYLMYKDTTKV